LVLLARVASYSYQNFSIIVSSKASSGDKTVRAARVAQITIIW